jgi:hypothetical protein
MPGTPAQVRRFRRLMALSGARVRHTLFKSPFKSSHNPLKPPPPNLHLLSAGPRQPRRDFTTHRTFLRDPPAQLSESVMASSAPEYQIGLALSGGCTAGAYQAGVVDFLYEALREWETERAKSPASALPAWRVRLRAMGGASAGGLTNRASRRTPIILCMTVGSQNLTTRVCLKQTTSSRASRRRARQQL